MFIIKSKYTKLEDIFKEYPNAVVFDVTSKGSLKKLSPFYPHGEIPVFGSGEYNEGLGLIEHNFKYYSASVEGVWQGMKVFEHEGIKPSCFTNTSMRGLKRKGKCLGHYYQGKLIGYKQARYLIYEPAYYYMLQYYNGRDLHYLGYLSEKGVVVLLDYNTNRDIEDISSPLSHASLIIEHIEYRNLSEKPPHEWLIKHAITNETFKRI